MSKIIPAHLKDIDFRTREQRAESWKEDFIEWYKDMHAHQELAYSDLVQGKIEMLSAVLWYLLPKEEFKQLTKRK
jgi:FMN-dependent NADH-azoreductase